MSRDLSALASLFPPRKPRRPVAEEMLSIRVRDVRPQVEVDDPAPDHRLEVTRAQELLKENAWATRQSSWHRGGTPRRGPEAERSVDF
mgnify:CR=1 FL=1